MIDIGSKLHSIQKLCESERWADVVPYLDSALAGEHQSDQELLTLCAAAVELGRLSAARALLSRALEAGAVSKHEAARLLLRNARRSLEKCGQRCLLGARPTQIDLSSSDLARWYRPEGELGVYYISTQVTESPLNQVGSACSELAERLRACSSNESCSEALQQVVVNSGYEALFLSAQVNLLQPFSSDFDGLRVLELDCQSGVRARFLAENGASVTAVTASPEHALLTAALCADLPCVDVVLDAPHTVPFKGLFDLVVIAGYQEEFVSSANVLNPLGHLLNRAYAALAPNGSLLISGHNALALRHFNDQRDVYGRGGAATLEGRGVPGAPQSLPSSTIRTALADSGFYSQGQCAFMGTLQSPNLLVSPLGCELSAERWNLETLVRRALVDSNQDRLARFSESRVMHTVVEGGQLQTWSDGYLFLAHKSPEQQIDIDGWLASYFSCIDDQLSGHESRFRRVQGQESNIEVVKRPLDGTGVDTGRPYIVGTVYRDLLDDSLQVPGWTFEQVLQWSAVWLRCLLSSLSSDDRLTREGGLAEGYAGDYDLWVPDHVLGATSMQWIKTDEGGFECIYEGAGTGSTVPMAMVLYAGLISTFSTLRSVAEPADNTWLEPVTLAEAVVGRLGYEVHSHDVDVVKTHWKQLKGTQLPVPSHFLARETPRALTDFAKLYWATESEGFSESKTSTDNLVLDGNVQTLRLTIASTEEHVTGLRFDVANRPGCFEVEVIFVVQADGEELWRWDHAREALSDVQGADLVIDPVAGRSCILSRGDDPQFVLNLPQSVLDSVAGGVLQVRLTARPQRL